MILSSSWQSLILLTVGLAVLMAGLIWIAQRFRFAAYAISALPPLIGIAVALQTLAADNGYSAAYGFGAAWLYMQLVAASNALLIPIPRFRRGAILGSLSGFALLFCFYLTMCVGYLCGYAHWNSESY